jgi:hypothetical protein
MLRDLGRRDSQGYGLARPMGADAKAGPAYRGARIRSPRFRWVYCGSLLKYRTAIGEYPP